MATYRIESSIVRTENATRSWDEATTHDGRNYISRATGSQWNHQRLHRSRRGRYWLECESDWQGSTPHAEWLSPEAAARWLLSQDHEIPDELRAAAAEVEE
jgi:hypothetical protein